MSSTLFVDAIEPNLSSGVHIAGHVIQVVHGTTSTPVTHSDAFADTTLSATITPLSASSKILILVVHHIYMSYRGGPIRLLRDATVVYNPIGYQTYFETANITARLQTGFNYMDTPATTSSIIYKTQAKRYTAANSFITQEGGDTQATITLMEIAQ